MKPIKLQIKKRITSYETNGYSYECDVYLNGQKLGHGVTELSRLLNINRQQVNRAIKGDNSPKAVEIRKKIYRVLNM